MKTLFFIAGFWLILSNFFALSQSAAYTDSEHAFNSHERNRHKHKILKILWKFSLFVLQMHHSGFSGFDEPVIVQK